MPELFTRYGDLAILGILFLEDLGVPMPLPADVALLYAGFRLRSHHAALLFVLSMFAAINLGATILYFVTRSGGRPLVDRFGCYIHLDEKRLNGLEAWLNRRGSLGIMVGRALPGARIVTVIACGIFRVPIRKYLVAQFIGVAAYMTVLLAAGYWLGPTAAEKIRLPAISFRLVFLILAVVICPIILGRLNRQTRDDDTRTIQAGLTSGERIASDLLAGFGGMLELTSIWTIFSTITRLTQRTEVSRAMLLLAHWVGHTNSRLLVYILDYGALLLVCLAGSVLFFQFIMPRLKIGPRQLFHQMLALWLASLVLISAAIVLSLFDHYFRRPDEVSLWLSHSGPTVLAVLVVALFGYAFVAVEVRRLAIDRFSDDPEIAPSANKALQIKAAATAGADGEEPSEHSGGPSRSRHPDPNQIHST